MPETVSISITTNNISTTNAIKMAIYKDSAPLAIVQYIDEAAGAHLARTWNFAGLERVMHFYKLLELDGSNNVINIIIGPIYFLPSDETIEVKPAKLIQVGITPIPGNEGVLWPAGVNDVFVPDWIGWDLEMFERIGQGSLKYDITSPVDMSYDPVTGYLHLLQPDDVFHEEDGVGEYFIARFKVRVTTGGSVSSSSASGFSDILVVTVDTELTEADIGKKIIIDPAANFLVLTLPNLSLVVDKKLLFIEMIESATAKSARITTGDSGNLIQWLEGNLVSVYICPSETIEFYKRVTGTPEWRVNNSDGNFKTVGQIIYDDAAASLVTNKILLDGSLKDYLQYARLYNRYILRLTANVVSYAAWSSGNTSKYKFSLKDTVSDNFRIPDSRYIYDRASNGALVPGDFQRMMIERHAHADAYGESHDSMFSHANSYGHVGSNSTDYDNDIFYTNNGSEIPGATIPMNATGVIGEETRPISRITNKYILI